MARSRRIFTGSGFTKLGLRLFGFAHVYHSSIECVVSRTLTSGILDNVVIACSLESIRLGLVN